MVALLAASLGAQVRPGDLVSIQLNSGVVQVVEGATGAVVNQVQVPVPAGGRSPDVAISADGTGGLAITFGTSGGTAHLIDFSVIPAVVVGAVPLAGPGIATFTSISCARRFAVVALYDDTPSGSPDVPIYVIDLQARTIAGQVLLPPDTYDVVMTPEGDRVFLAGFAQNAIYDCAVDSAGQIQVATTFNLGFRPYGLSLSPTGRTLAVVGGPLQILAVNPSGLTSLGATSNGGWTSVTFAPNGVDVFAGASTSIPRAPLGSPDTVGKFVLSSSGAPTGPVVTGATSAGSLNWISYNQMGISGDGSVLGFHDSLNLNLFDTATLARIATVPSQSTEGGAVTGRCSSLSNLQLRFGQAPSGLPIATQIWPAFTVQLLDRLGAPLANATDAVTVALRQPAGPLLGTTTRNAINGVASFDDLRYDASETVWLEVTAVGASPPLTARLVVLPRDSDLRITATGVTSTPPAPIRGVPGTLTALVQNVGQRAATASVSFFLGDPAFGGTLIGAVVGSIPVGSTALFNQIWTPNSNGVQPIVVVVNNLTPPEANPADNRASRSFFVGTAPESLAISTTPRVAWPGSSAEVTITVRNTGIAPVTLGAATAGAPGWLTVLSSVTGVVLGPNQTTVLLARLDVPTGAVGAPVGGLPAIQEIPVQVVTTTPGLFVGDFRVELFDQPLTSVTIAVVDDVTGAPLPGTLVAAQEFAGNVVTDAFGEATLPLPPGPRSVFAYRQGYVAKAETLAIPSGTSRQVLRLEPGATLQIREIVVSPPLTTQEIINRGVNVRDPINNVVVDFVIVVEARQQQPQRPLVLPNIEIPQAPPVGTVLTFGGVASSPTGGAAVQARFEYTPYGRTEVWAILPGTVSTLREFFDVTMVVVNNATAPNPQDVQIRNGRAQLAPPAGIGLPDLNSVPQPLAIDLPTLDAGESATATWVIRGDAPGTYRLSGAVTGDLFAFGSQVAALSATATSEEFVVTVPSIRCEFLTDELVPANVPVAFEILLTNTGERRAQLVRIEIGLTELAGGVFNLEIAPVQRQATLVYDSASRIIGAFIDIGDLELGQSALAVFDLIPRIGGRIRGFGMASATSPDCGLEPYSQLEIVSLPPVITADPLPQRLCAGAPALLSVAANGEQLAYQWEKNGQPILNANGPTLAFPVTTPADTGLYSVAVSNPSGTVFSAGAQLTVDAPPSITREPTGALVPLGAPVQVDVVASGSGPLVYQWFKNSVELTGQSGPVLILPAMGRADIGFYEVRISNICGAVTSRSVRVAIRASTRNYGSGVAGELGIPPLTLSGMPLVNAPGLQIEVGSSASQPVPAIVILGYAPSSLPLLGGQLLVVPASTFGVLIPQAGLSIPFTAGSATEGLQFLLQSALLDPAAPAGVALSRGLEFVIGQ